MCGGDAENMLEDQRLVATYGMIRRETVFGEFSRINEGAFGIRNEHARLIAEVSSAYRPFAAVAGPTVTGTNSFTTFASLGLMSRTFPSSPAAAASVPSDL